MNVCMIPVRMGSERLAKKNYLKVGDVTVLELAIRKAKKADVFDSIVLNTDDPGLEEVADRFGVDFYLRSEELANSTATSDQLVLDFFDHCQASRVFWLNTVSPLQTVEDIVAFFKVSQDRSWSSGVSASNALVHSFFDSKPLNFDWGGGFARTQDLKPVQQLNYAMMGWHRSMIERLALGHLFDLKTTILQSSRWSSFLLKNEEDLAIIRALMSIAPDQGK